MNDNSTTAAAVDSNEADVAGYAAKPDVDSDYDLFQQILVEDDEPLPSMESTGIPGGGIAFDSRDYASDEEADAAMEAFLMKALGASDEQGQGELGIREPCSSRSGPLPEIPAQKSG
jgi:hypothetical protein